MTLATAVYAHCDLLSTSGITGLVIGNGNTLTVGGLVAIDLQLQRVLLVYDGDPDVHSTGVFSSFGNVSFTGYNATDVQFTIVDADATFTLPTSGTITFDTTPTTGGFYLRAVDSVPGGPVLTINFTANVPGPSCSAAEFDEQGGASILSTCS